MGWSVMEAPPERGVSIDRREILDSLPVLVDGSARCELRGLPRAGTLARRGDDHGGIADDAEALDARGAAGVYYVINPTPHGMAGSANDTHPIRRRWLLIDVDPPKPAGVSANATAGEKGRAEALASRVAEYLAGCAWPAPAVVDSGNGRQLLYPCDLPNDEPSKLAVKALLRYLAGRFDEPGGARIDTSVYNASRVAKLPGTVARKGPHTEERPHRVARLLSLPGGTRVRLGDVLRATGGADAETVVDTPAPAPKSPDGNPWSVLVATADARPDTWDRAVAYLRECPGAVSGSGGHPQTMSVARAVVHGFGLGSQVGYSLLEQHYNPRCVPPWSEGELRHKCADAERTPDPAGRPWGYLLDLDDEKGVHSMHPLDGTAPQPDGWDYLPITTAKLLDAPAPQWLIDDILVVGQPAVMGGPLKAFKTSIALDLVVSLATATPFLGTFNVPAPRRVAVLSGESGQWTIGQTVRRVCASRDLAPESLPIDWMFDLPKLTSERHMARLCAGLEKSRIEAVFLDPLYLCLLGGGGNKNEARAENLYQIGPLLLNVARSCLKVGATPVLLHHSGKAFARSYEPPELTDLAFAGIGEFARQWLMLGWRERYDPAGVRKLWFSASGSVGHGGLWALDIREGRLGTDFGGRTWGVDVRPAADVHGEARSASGAARAEVAVTREGEEEKKVLDALQALSGGHSDGVSHTELRGASGISYERFAACVFRLLRREAIAEVPGFTVIGGQGARIRSKGYRIVEDAFD